MALANVAALLSKWGQKVLVVDWDLEAPGIEKYFESVSQELTKIRKRKKSLIDIIEGHGSWKTFVWKNCLIEIELFGKGNPIYLISVGKLNDYYSFRV